MKRKAGKVPCPICGELYYRSGLVGHMRWQHKREYKAPLLPSKAEPYITTLERKVAMSAESRKSFKRELSIGTQHLKKAQKLLSAGGLAAAPEAVKEIAKATKSDKRALALFK